jgi:hypothetical protein
MRIRPICVAALLTGGLTWAVAPAGAQPWPGYGPGGYPMAPMMPYGPMPNYYPPPPYNPQFAPPAPAYPGYAPYSNGYPNYPTAPVARGPAVPVLPAANAQPGAPAPAAPVSDKAAPPGSAAPTGPPPAAADPTTSPTGPVVASPPSMPSEPMVTFLNQPPAGCLTSCPDPYEIGDLIPKRVTNDHCWITIDYLMGFIRNERTPAPLLTVGALSDMHPAALGQPGTAVIVGNEFTFNMQSGARLNLGCFLDHSCHFSIEAEGMYYFPTRLSFSAASDQSGNPIIGRPVFDVVTGIERAAIDSQPAAAGTVVGNALINLDSKLYGAEVNGRYHFNVADHWHANILYGFRWVHLDESITIQDFLSPQMDNVLTFLGPAPVNGGTGLPVPAGSTITDLDSFRTTNNFFGFNFGGQITWDKDWWFCSAFTKIAVGPTVEQVLINGNSTLTPPGGPTTTAVGGVLALSSNIGTYHRTVLTVVPEAGLNIGINVHPNLQIIAGYSYLAWTNVVRPGNQISHAINSTEVPTNNTFGQGLPPAAPLFRFVGETFWINSFNVGVNWHF